MLLEAVTSVICGLDNSHLPQTQSRPRARESWTALCLCHQHRSNNMVLSPTFDIPVCSWCCKLSDTIVEVLVLIRKLLWSTTLVCLVLLPVLHIFQVKVCTTKLLQDHLPVEMPPKHLPSLFENVSKRSTGRIVVSLLC